MKWITLIAIVAVHSWTLHAKASLPTLTQVVINDEGENLLADNTGKTLYLFDMDKGKEAPACNGDCAEVWPPYLVTAAEAKTLIAPLGTLARKNKQLQLTYNGSPVYTYAFDRHMADDQGDGLGGVWHYIEIEAPSKDVK